MEISPFLPSSACEDVCCVCGDKASGYHYNALTCEGCKGFFRRAVTRRATFSCKYGRSCDIDLYMRKRCQHCRMEKCLQSGMKAELVIPEEQCRQKRQAKQRQGGEEWMPSMPSSSHSPVTTMTNPSECSQHSFLSEYSLSEECSELIFRTLSVYRECSAPSDEQLSQLTVCDGSPSSWRERIIQLTILHAQLAHEFASRLPGMTRFTEEDRDILLKESKRELLALRYAITFNAADGSIRMGSESEECRCDEECLSEVDGLASHLFSFAPSISSLQLDSVEASLLSAIIVFSERANVSSCSVVDEVAEVYSSHLRTYVEATRPSSPSRFSTLLLKIVDLRTMTAKEDAGLDGERRRKSEEEEAFTLSYRPIHTAHHRSL